MEIIENRPLGEKIYKHVLNNGLTIYIMPKPGYNKQFAIYATNYGSNDVRFMREGDEKPIEVPLGIAHFLEHKLFEEETGSIFEKFGAFGAQANAFTNFTMTAYLFASAGNFYECLRLLLDFVNRPYFTDENVEKEKGIIAQEIRMYDDNPEWRVYFNLLRALYKNYPVKYDIAGTVESIMSITKEQLYLCYNTFYAPNNMAVFVTGDIDEKKVLETVDESLASKRESGCAIKRLYPEEPMEIVTPIVRQQLEVALPVFYIGFKDTKVGMSGYKLMRKNITTAILLDMLIGKSSDTYQELYEEGLINASFGNEYMSEYDYAASLIGGESPRPLEVRDRILEAAENYKKAGLNEGDFLRIKRKMLGNFIMNLNRIDGIATAYVSESFKDINFLDYPKVIEDVKLEEIEERLREHLDEKYCAISIVEPKK